MRILHLLSQTELTGAEVHVQRLADHQHQGKLKVWIISDKLHIPIPQADFISKALSTRSFWKRMANIFWLIHFLRREKIDIVHCHSRAASRHAFWACLFAPASQVTTLHGRQHFSWSKRFLDIYGQYMICICKNVGESMLVQFRTKKWKLKYANNPIDTQRFKIALPPLQKQIAKKQKIAIIGRSSGPKGKRIEGLIEHCCQPWLAEFPELEIDIIAPQSNLLSAKTHERISHLQNSFAQRLKIMPHVGNLHEHYHNYVAVIGSGRVAIEAILSGINCLSLGEYEYLGPVTSENWQQSKASNFGDIGSQELELTFNWTTVTKDLVSILHQTRQTPSTSLATEIDSKINSPAHVLSQLAANDFSDINIHQQVLDVYRSAIFKKRIPRHIPVLMYHKIPENELQTRHRIYVCKNIFEKHLRFLRQSGFTGLTFSDLSNYWMLKKDYSLFPRKPVLLTFDDGYRDNLLHADPLLKKYNFKATIFLLADHRIVSNTWDQIDETEPTAEIMSLAEKQSLDPETWEVGSHGFQHLHLNQVPRDLALTEMQTSKHQLENDLKKPVFAFAYPFGSTNEELPELSQLAGYQFAVNTDKGGLHLADNPRSIFRVNIFPEDGVPQLRKKTSSWYRRYYFIKRGQ